MIRAILQRLGRKAIAWVIAIVLALAWKGGTYVFNLITGQSNTEQTADGTAVEDDDDGDKSESPDDDGEGTGSSAIRPVSVPESGAPARSSLPPGGTNPGTVPASTGAGEVADDSVAPPPSRPRTADPNALHFSDAAPPDKQLSSELQRDLRGPLESWVFAWRIGLGTFRLDQLEQKSVTKLTNDEVAPWDGNAEGEDLRLLHLAIPSPEATRVVDAHMDLELVPRGELVRARRVRPAGVALIDLKRRFIHRVLWGEEDTRYDGAQWIDGDRFVVMAAERKEARLFEGGPVLYLIDLREETITRYQGPLGDRNAWDKVQSEVERRFRQERQTLAFG
ncbi:MAG: hypothetical protein ACREOU_07565 [Candidatus Eiseniibacteriota bacterium]